MSNEESNLVSHARYELKRAGLTDKDSDYDGLLAESVLKLIELFSSQGHSGASAFMTIDLFTKLASFESLTPLTNDPDEWIEVGPRIWQNRRNSKAFSLSGGATHYLVDNPDKIIKSEDAK